MQSPTSVHQPLHRFASRSGLFSPWADPQDRSLIFLVSVPLLTLLLVQDALRASCPLAFPNLNLFFAC